jgi:hypothetical protein
MTRIVAVKPLEGFRLNVRFNDGFEGVYAVEPRRRGGVFLKLLEPSVFNAVTINPDFGCVEWSGGIDLCPDTMHQEMTGAEAELHPPMALREGNEKKS